jgi:hypothetical protein
MAFRISKIGKKGTRIESILVEGLCAEVSSSADATLQTEMAEGASVKIESKGTKLLLSVVGTVLKVNEEVISESIIVRNSTDFSCSGSDFYVTNVINEEICRRKKSFLSVFALTTVWSLLALMLIVPAWLPYRIRTHENKGRNVLVDKCSGGLDKLRRRVKKEMKDLEQYSQIKREVMTSISEEIEQISWVFRNSGDFMNQQKMLQLEKDIQLYNDVLKKIKGTDAVIIKPLNSRQTLKSILLPK